MYKGPLILTSCSGPSLCIAGVVPHLVGTAWAQHGHSECSSYLRSLSSSSLTSAFLKRSQSMAPCWSSSSSFRTWGSRQLTAAVQGETKKGAHALQGESFTRSGFLVQGRAMWRARGGKMMAMASHRPGLVRVQESSSKELVEEVLMLVD